MPELPEVETVRAGLLPVMEGQLITLAQVNRPDLRFPLPERMAERLTGQRVEGLRRRSKYILADLSSGETLLVHLGMSGRMLVSGAMLGTFTTSIPHLPSMTMWCFDMENGARVTFNDARRFGAMDLMTTATAQDHIGFLKDLGPEPLGNGFHEDYLAGRLSGRAMPVKAALLDQRIVAGLGNIYVSEACSAPGSIRAGPQET
jgi:formamidopyrimidine-DNA glycosylase